MNCKSCFESLILKVVILTVFFIFPGGKIFGEVYYVSTSGNDSSPGTSPEKAWETIERVNVQNLYPGDSVLFSCGESFTGQLKIHNSGSPEKAIVLSNYGQGERPILTGAIKISGWKKYDENIIYTEVKDPVNALIVNNADATLARYPNNSFLTVDQGIDKAGLEDAELTQKDSYWNNATIRIRSIDWVYEVRKIKDYVKGQLLFEAHEDYPVAEGFDYRFDNNLNQTMYSILPGYGYYLENKFSLLDAPGEWFYEAESGRLFFYGSEKNVFEAVNHQTGIFLDSAVHDINIDGFNISKYSYAGTYSRYNVQNILVKNCSFENIEGYGVCFNGIPTNCKIENNSFRDIYGRGVSLVRASNCSVIGNDLKRIGLKRGYGVSGINGASGIILMNIETKVQNPPYSSNNLISHNRIDSCGYIGIRIDGHDNLIEYNYLNNSMLTLNDGAGIYCFARQYNVSYNNNIRNNIVMNTKGDNQASPSNKIIVNGIYLDNYTHENRVENNSVAYSSGSGILVNDASNRNLIFNNKLFGNNSGIGFSEWKDTGQNYGNKVFGNLIFCTTDSQKAIEIQNFIGDQIDMAEFQNNIYCNLKEKHMFRIRTKHVNKVSEFNYNGWKERVRKDSGSIAITPMSARKYKGGGMFVYNPGKNALCYDVKLNTAFMMDETGVGKQISLDPFCSEILLFTKPNYYIKEE